MASTGPLAPIARAEISEHRVRRSLSSRVTGGFALMRKPMVGGLAVHRQIQRVIFVVIAALICAALAIPFQARAETPLAAFCATTRLTFRELHMRWGLINRNGPVT